MRDATWDETRDASGDVAGDTASADTATPAPVDGGAPRDKNGPPQPKPETHGDPWWRVGQRGVGHTGAVPTVAARPPWSPAPASRSPLEEGGRVAAEEARRSVPIRAVQVRQGVGVQGGEGRWGPLRQTLPLRPPRGRWERPVRRGEPPTPASSPAPPRRGPKATRDAGGKDPEGVRRGRVGGRARQPEAAGGPGPEAGTQTGGARSGTVERTRQGVLLRQPLLRVARRVPVGLPGPPAGTTVPPPDVCEADVRPTVPGALRAVRVARLLPGRCASVVVAARGGRARCRARVLGEGDLARGQRRARGRRGFEARGRARRREGPREPGRGRPERDAEGGGGGRRDPAGSRARWPRRPVDHPEAPRGTALGPPRGAG